MWIAVHTHRERVTTHETMRPTVPLPEGSGTYGGDDGPVGPDMTKAMRMVVFLNCGRGVQIEVRNAQRDLNGRRTRGAGPDRNRGLAAVPGPCGCVNSIGWKIRFFFFIEFPLPETAG